MFAGVGGYSYLYEPLWWAGMITSEFAFSFPSNGFGSKPWIPLNDLCAAVSLKLGYSCTYFFKI